MDESAIEAIVALVEEMLWAGSLGPASASARVRAALVVLVGEDRTTALFESYA